MVPSGRGEGCVGMAVVVVECSGSLTHLVQKEMDFLHEHKTFVCHEPTLYHALHRWPKEMMGNGDMPAG